MEVQVVQPEDPGLVAARNILLSGGFYSMPEDQFRRKDNGFTIGETQGTPNLRIAARRHTTQCSQGLAPYNLREASSSNPRTFRILQIKRVGHVFNLSDYIRQKDGSSFHLNGFSEAFTLPMIASSVGEYSKQKESKISENEGSWISQLLNNSSSHDSYVDGNEHVLHKLIGDPSYSDVITIASGYDWHATHLFYFRGFLIYCNRGAGSGTEPGIHVYRVPDSERITPDLIKGLICRHKITTELWNEKYNISALVQTLGLEKVVHLKQKNQKTGNCTYITTKCAVRAILAIGALVEQFDNSPLPKDKDIWIKAFDQTREKYKDWCKFDKNLVVNDLLKDCIYLDQLEDRMISQGEFRKIFRMVKEKVLAKRHYFPDAVRILSGLRQI